MKSYFCWLSFLSILLAMPLAASMSRIWVLSRKDNRIDVIDTATNKVVQTIPGIKAPHGVDFSPDGNRAYVTSESNDYTVTVVDTKTGKTIKKVPVSGYAELPAVTRGNRVFVCIGEPHGAVDIVDTTSLEKVKSLPMKDVMHDCFLTPDGKYVVAGSSHGKFLVVIDVQTEQPVWEMTFDRGVQTFAMEAGPDGSTRRILINLHMFHGFAVVDFATHKEVARITLPEKPGAFDIGPEEKVHGSAVAPDGKTYWVNSGPNNAIYAYSLPDLKLLGSVPLPELKRSGEATVPSIPHWVSFSHDGKTVYECNSYLNSVSAIDVKTRKEVVQIPVGGHPRQMGTLVLP